MSTAVAKKKSAELSTDVMDDMFADGGEGAAHVLVLEGGSCAPWTFHLCGGGGGSGEDAVEYGVGYANVLPGEGVEADDEGAGSV